MTNSYSLSSVFIPCTHQQASAAVEAFFQLEEGLEDDALRRLKITNDDKLSEIDRIVKHSYDNHPDCSLSKPNENEYVHWEFDTSIKDDEEVGLLIESNQSFNSEHASVFIRSFLQAFDLPLIVPIEVAHTCDRQLPGAFGGHSLVVTKDFIRYDAGHEFTMAEMTAHKDAARYYICSSTMNSVNAKRVHRVHFLLQCTGNAEPIESIHNLYNDGTIHVDVDGSDWIVDFADGTKLTDPDFRELDPSEFVMLSKFHHVEYSPQPIQTCL